MSNHDAPAAAAGALGHNQSPVTVPEEDALNADLAKRYPTALTDLEEILEAEKHVPDEIKDEETAGKVQALLKKTSALKNSWEALGKVEKKPWTNVASIVRSWFQTKEDKAEALIKNIKPRLTKYLDAKAEAVRLEEERKAEEARLAAEESKMDQLWAEARVELAAYDERKAREREAEARRLEEEAREDQMWAEARAELAAYDERKANERRAALLAEQAARRKTRKADLSKLVKESKGLALLDEAGTMDDTQRARYQELIKKDGLIATLQQQLEQERGMLTDEERAELDAEEAALAECRAARKALHEKAEAAAAQAREHRQTGNAAATEARSHERVGDKAERTAASAEKTAAKLDNRANRQELKSENLTDADASRTRGEGGSVGTLSGQWHPRVLDYDAGLDDVLVALAKAGKKSLLPELWEHIPQEAKDAAITKWRMAHQAEWADRKGSGVGQGKVADALPGVEFIWVPDARIAG